MDLIDRQAAIDALEEVDWYHQNKDKDMVLGANPPEHQAWYKEDDIFKTLEALPSAQPEKMQLSREDATFDCISRQAAIDAVKCGALSAAMVYGRTEEGSTALCETVKAIKAVPSAQPEQRWIPCSERLPEEDYCTGRGIQHSESVLVTIVNHANDDDVFVDMACTVDGKWQLTYPFDDDPDIPKWCEIIAWMPLPEPYKGGQDGH